jgi:predicted transcriptional regulator
MGRPPGRTKTARISVSFEPQVYGALVGLAKRQDVPVAQIIRRAVAQMVAPEVAANGAPSGGPADNAAGHA